MTFYFDAGALRFPLLCQEPADLSDSTDDAAVSLPPAYHIWAHIAPQNGQDQWISDAEQNVITHIITIRWRKKFSTATKLSYGERYFHILSCYDPDERHNWLILHCQEIGH